MVHIACCFERLVAGTCSPSNRWADEILQEDAILYQKLLEILAPMETAFGVKLPKEEFANIIVILKKLRSLQQQPRRATSANAKHTAPPRWAKRSRAAQCC